MIHTASPWFVRMAAAGLILLFGTGCQQHYYDMVEMENAALARSPAVGMEAPLFTLNNQNEEPVSLADLRGRWVVLYFYPEDDTPGCACEATEFTHLLEAFRDMNAIVYGISMDSEKSHRFFIGKYDLKIDLLSDPAHRVMEEYGAWVDVKFGPKSFGRVIRSSFIIDPQGIVRYHCAEVIPMGHAQRVKEHLQRLQSS